MQATSQRRITGTTLLEDLLSIGDLVGARTVPVYPSTSLFLAYLYSLIHCLSVHADKIISVISALTIPIMSTPKTLKIILVDTGTNGSACPEPFASVTSSYPFQLDID